jgi:[ribosomal protein S18]-alanine N-acetyltransferase
MYELSTLQPAVLAEAAQIASLSNRLIEAGLPVTWTTQRVAAQICHRESMVLTAKEADELIGFAIMQFGNERAHLNLLAVLPGARRYGVGRRMLGWLHESALTAGTFTIELELRAENLVARRFYGSMGYAECGYTRNYYSGKEDAVHMKRDLTVRPLVA